MKTTTATIQQMVILTTMLVLSSLTFSGCKTAPTQLGEPPSASEGQSKTLEKILLDIEENQDLFRSLTAEGQILIQSPLLPSRTPQLQLDAELKLLKPRRIRLVIYRGGQVAMTLTGNGEKYKVRQPIFDDTYGGEYDSAITNSSNRLHIMPDDLADALDLQSLFHGRPQALKSYPERWDIMPGSLQNPVTYPPVWLIDSLVFSPGDDINTRVVNSIMIDRRNSQVQRIDKFSKNGNLRVRMWYRNVIPVQTPDGDTVDLPRNILIWYPPPLEGTIINLRLDKYKINPEVEESEFSLGG